MVMKGIIIRLSKMVLTKALAFPKIKPESGISAGNVPCTANVLKMSAVKIIFILRL